MPDMFTTSNTQLPPPKYWQEFETLCWDLWKHIWADPETHKNGRAGQAQHGVDIYGRLNGSDQLAGIQCKLKSDWETGELTYREIDQEVQKARKFIPKLSKFIIATTAKKDGKAEAIARKITQQHLAEGLFTVTIIFWDDILDRFSDYPVLEKKYFSYLTHAEDEESEESTILDYIRRENKYVLTFFGMPLQVRHLNYVVWIFFAISVISMLTFFVITNGKFVLGDPIFTILIVVISMVSCGLALKAFSYFSSIIEQLQNYRFLHFFTIGRNIELDNKGFVWLTQMTGECPACGDKLKLQYDPSVGYLFMCKRNTGHWWGFDYTAYPIDQI